MYDCMVKVGKLQLNDFSIYIEIRHSYQLLVNLNRLSVRTTSLKWNSYLV